jgi:hypothetical protein
MLELQDRQAPEQAPNVGMPAGNTPAPVPAERPAEAKSTALVDYSKKYWWVGVVVMPILLLILNKVWGSGDPVKPSPSVSIDARDYSQTVQNVQNNIQQFLGQPIDDSLRRKIEEAAEFAARGRHKEALSRYREIAQTAAAPAVLMQIGLAAQALDDRSSAREALLKAAAAGYLPAQKWLQAMEDNKVAVSGSGGREQEPNNDNRSANRIELNARVAATILPEKDADVYQFTTPSGSRDIMMITIEPASTGLVSAWQLFDGNGRPVTHGGASAGGEKLEYKFASEPGATYYLHISSPDWSQSTGAYTVTVAPLKAFDAYEPNNNIRNPAQLRLSSTAKASIMDAGDVDVYEFPAPAKGKIIATVENFSDTLVPMVTVLNHQGERLGEHSNNTPGSRLEYTFEVSPDKPFYVVVQSPAWSGTAGNYGLTVRPQ